MDEVGVKSGVIRKPERGPPEKAPGDSSEELRRSFFGMNWEIKQGSVWGELAAVQA